MPCTTILVGKKASYDGSTMIARTDDGFYDIKKTIVVEPKDQKKKYKSVIGHLEIELPDDPIRYTCSPSVDLKDGIWAATGINADNVGMSATETITTNPRVMGADPYVEYQKAKNKKEKDVPGGIGEEDLLVLVLPYVHSAREGVLRLGKLLEQYGTYESNGISFNDADEVWWMETIGGHHWMARKVRDEEVVIMPNQFGMDHFDLEDALGEKKENLCSADLKEFIAKNHLDLNQNGEFNPRWIFGSHSDADHIYNTPRAWFMGRYLNPTRYKWEGPNADFTPESDNIPWSLIPEKKVTVEDMKYLLSSYYQGTPYNPYQKADTPERGHYRTIGINRTGVTNICQIRGYLPKSIQAVEWILYGPTVFAAALPVYTNVRKLPAYVSEVTMDTSTENFYYGSRLISALVDPHYGSCIQHVERFHTAIANKSHHILNQYDEKYIQELKKAQSADCENQTEPKAEALLEEANRKLCDMARKETTSTLNKVLLTATMNMKCGYNRADK